MRAFRVDTEHLKGSVDNIQAAFERLNGLKDMLGDLHGGMADTDADGNMGSFRDRWSDEFGIVGDMMDKFKEAITSAADAYDKADQELANGFNGPPAEA